MELTAIKLKTEIVVNGVKITPLDEEHFENELVKYSDGGIAFRYRNRSSAASVTKPRIYIDAKLFWQKAQQQF